MKEYTFWSKQTPAPVRTSLAVAAAAFLAWGLVNIGYGLGFEPPNRSSLTTVFGKLADVTRLPQGRFAGARIDVAVMSADGSRTSAKIFNRSESYRPLSGLVNQDVELKIDDDHWVFAFSSGGREIFSYDQMRQLWLKDSRGRVEFGAAVALIGLLLGAGWLLRRRKMRSGSQAE
jgi:hypothetical protein